MTGPENPNDDSRGILVDNGIGSIEVLLTITGSGTLTATGHPSSKNSYGIVTNPSDTDTGDITIGADTTVNAGT